MRIPPPPATAYTDATARPKTAIAVQYSLQTAENFYYPHFTEILHRMTLNLTDLDKGKFQVPQFKKKIYLGLAYYFHEMHLHANFGVLITKCTVQLNFGLRLTSKTLDCSSLPVFVFSFFPALFFISRVAIQSIERKRVFLQVCCLSHLSVCLSLSVCLCVWKVYCGKMADWIRMPFGVVNGVY